jgi:hypothetical protein
VERTSNLDLLSIPDVSFVKGRESGVKWTLMSVPSPCSPTLGETMAMPGAPALHTTRQLTSNTERIIALAILSMEPPTVRKFMC